MNYGEIKACDIANGEGIRVSLFVSGCRNCCKGCFNSQTWDFSFGEPYTEQTKEKILQLMAPEHITGLTLLGGEPFEPENQCELLPLLREAKKRYPNKDIWAYSGCVLETDILAGRAYCEATDEMLSLIDVLVDGPFILEKKNISLKYRGSENQRIIDVKKTLASGEIVNWQSSCDPVFVPLKSR